MQLQGSTRIGWALFDPIWYLATYPAARQSVGDRSPAEILQFYLEHGQALNHSPNIYFAETWHRRKYPRVAAAVSRGQFASAFDAYCREGFNGRSPHWLFDEIFYRTRYADLTEDYLVANGTVNGYDHYLRHGDRSARSGHVLFDPVFYAFGLNDEEQRTAEEQGCFTHYLRGLTSKRPEPRTTIYFDPSWHVAAWKETAETGDPQDWLCALHHYLCNETPTKFDPLPEFSEDYYLARYSDVASDVHTGRYRNGYEHFLAKGREELRSPSRQIDLAYYASRADVVSSFQEGRSGDAFTHYLMIGRLQELPTSTEQAISQESAQLLFRQKANVLLPLRGRHKIAFQRHEQAELSVLMVLHDQFPLTLMALASLRDNYPGPLELILVDSGSTDETRHIARYVSGANILRFEHNIGFLRGCNAGLQFTTTDFVLFLNNDVELAHDAVGAALRRLKSHPNAGAVGGKVVRCHGLLQEAGSVIWRDGTTSGYLRGQSPLAPEANFVRKVDYCSGVFLMVRGDLVRQLEGFDEGFAPAYYEDADLCIRVVQAGFDILYDTSVIIFHYEHGSAKKGGAPTAEMDRNRAIFFAKASQPFAMSPGQGRLETSLLSL